MSATPGSYIWRCRAVLRSPRTPSERLVLFSLADHASDGELGETWISVATIAREAAVTTRTVRNVLHALKKLEIIENKTDRNGHKVFVVNWSAIDRPASDAAKPETVSTKPETVSTKHADQPETVSTRPETVSTRPEIISTKPETVSAPIRTTQEQPKNNPRTTQSKSSLIPDWEFSLGDGVKASKVSKKAAEVFEYWWIRRKKASGQPSKLTTQSLRQLNGALKRHSTEDLKHYVRWAIEAQPPHIEEGFAWGWRKGCPVPMFSLLFRSSRISEHLETALRWDPDKARPGPSLVDPEPPKPVVRKAGAELAWAELLASVVGSGGLKSSLYRGMLSGLPSRSAELWEGVERCGGWDEVCRLVARSRSMPDVWAEWWTEREAA